MTPDTTRVRGAIACLVAGVALLIPFEHPVPVALGIVALLAFVVLGLFAVATPEFLAGDRPEGEHGASDGPGA